MAPLIEIQKLSKLYKNKYRNDPVLQNINLQIMKGHSVAITGKSGCGKTTFLNILSTLQKADSGEIFVDGKNILDLTLTQQALYRKNYIGYIPQSLYLLNDRNVYHNIALPLQYLGFQRSEISQMVQLAAERVNIGDLLHKQIPELSGGEQQRVAICRAVVKKPCILLADEPTSSLDDSTERLILELFMDLQSAGCTIITSTHDINVASFCTKIYELRNCQINEIK